MGVGLAGGGHVAAGAGWRRFCEGPWREEAGATEVVQHPELVVHKLLLQHPEHVNRCCGSMQQPRLRAATD